MQKYVLILAGGTGSRAGGPLPKQFQIIGGKRMFAWSIEAFREYDPLCHIILVVHPDYVGRKEFYDDFECPESLLHIVPGGSSRIASVKNGLSYISTLPYFNSESIVFIHDAARPCITVPVIERCATLVREGVGVVPVIPLSDSIRMLTSGGSIAVDRQKFVAVQTPQVFRAGNIQAAYDALTDETGFTDDASVAENLGLKIITCPGDPVNIKVTNPSDFERISL